MNNSIIELSTLQIISSYVFILLLLFIVRLKKLNREKEILVASIRMTLQLILTGYILEYIFNVNSPIVTIAAIIAMETFAVYNIFKRVKLSLTAAMKRVVAFSMVCGTIISIVYFIFAVIWLKPWYDPRYFIPLSGMIIGNSMTGITLCVERLVNGMKTERDLIDAALMLGATPKLASKHITDKAFNSAILPTINSMVGMGIVFIPGMMTGQILSGVSPVTAITYQIAIMAGIVGSVTLTITMLTHLGYRTFFNKDVQLII